MKLYSILKRVPPEVLGIVSGILGIILMIMLLIVVSTYWQCISAAIEGKAEYRKAEANRRIVILEAEAAKESAAHLAQAERIRAMGVADANQIIGDSLKHNEAYLRYRWIEGLQTNQMQVIYVPTEGNLPILEAGKR